MRSGIMVTVVVAVLVVSGVGFYVVTLPPSGTHTSNTGSSSTSAGGTGSQLPDGTPLGTWSTYLGYVPQGYKVTPLTGTSAHFSCPTGMSAAQCAVFTTTCGNGVCDPNETCNTCPLDCSTTGAQVCDPFTGRGGSPASICQQIITAGAG